MVLVRYSICLGNDDLVKSVDIVVRIKTINGQFTINQVYNAITQKLGHDQWRAVGYTFDTISLA